ncbi:class I SAM-dependent methyltransferase [Paenibacillus sp. P26]|nr:class I SAM-dependent methyltransferase [Paenibacillus sp. P26]
MSGLFNKYYDRLMAPLEDRAFAPIRRRLLRKAKGTVLEVGSGTGINFPYYGEADRVFAVEPETVMLEQSLARAGLAAVPIEVVQAGAERPPFPADYFDTVVGTLVFCTIPDPLAAMHEIRRVLRPGGTVLLLEHVRLRHPVWGGFRIR